MIKHPTYTTAAPTNNDAPIQVYPSSWQSTNVSPIEGWFSGIGGSMLATYGLLRRDKLGLALALIGGGLIYRGVSRHSYLYQALNVNTQPQDTLSVVSVPHRKGVKIEKVLTINRTPQELYRFWRDFTNLPTVMSHLARVDVYDATHSHWTLADPGNGAIAWDAEIINEQGDTLIAWRSLPGSTVHHAGSVHFTPAPGGHGTEVRVMLEYVPLAGRLGTMLAKLFRAAPEQQVLDDLRHFKAIMEAGEIPTTKGQPAGS